MGWFFVFLCAISEIVGVIGLKMYSKDKTLANGAIYIGGFATSFAFCILPSYFTSVARWFDWYRNSGCSFVKHVLVCESKVKRVSLVFLMRVE